MTVINRRKALEGIGQTRIVVVDIGKDSRESKQSSVIYD